MLSGLVHTGPFLVIKLFSILYWDLTSEKQGGTNLPHFIDQKTGVLDE